MFTPLTGRTVLVTGGTKGIGKGIARRLRARGRATSRSPAATPRAASSAAELTARRRAGQLRARPTSPTPDGLRAHGRETVSGTAALDVLCANAGIFPDVKLADMTAAGHRRDLRHQREGHDARRSRPRCPRSTRSGHGRVIVTSSITGPITGFPRLVALRRDARRRSSASCAPPRSSSPRSGITINAVMPGNIVTEGLDELGAEYRATMEASIPQRPARAASRTSATPRCSSPPTRPATSPGRRSWSTAARSCRNRSRPWGDPEPPASGPAPRPRVVGGRGRAGPAAGPDLLRRAAPRRPAGRRAGAGRPAVGQPVHPAAGARRAGAGGRGAPGARPDRRHLRRAHQGRPGPVGHRRAARVPAAAGLLRGHPGAVRHDRGGRRAGRGPARAAGGRAGAGHRPDPAGRLDPDLAGARRLPAESFPGLLEQPLGGSIYELLEGRYGIRPADVVEHLEVVGATADEASLLGVGPGTPLLAITRTSSTSGGVPFEFSKDLFRADRTRVTFRTRAERAQIDQLADNGGRQSELARLPGPRVEGTP